MSKAIREAEKRARERERLKAKPMPAVQRYARKLWKRLWNCAVCGEEVIYNEETGRLWCACGERFVSRADWLKEKGNFEPLIEKSMRAEEEVRGKKERLEARMAREMGFTQAILDTEIKVLKWTLKELEKLPFEES